MLRWLAETKPTVEIEAIFLSRMTLMTYNKLRIGRTSIPGQTYLITMVTEQRKRIFADVFLGRIVVNTMRIHDIENATRTWAFVVMLDHVHWLF